MVNPQRVYPSFPERTVNQIKMKGKLCEKEIRDYILALLELTLIKNLIGIFLAFAVLIMLATFGGNLPMSNII